VLDEKTVSIIGVIMDWKEFLKPSNTKLFIFAVIAIVLVPIVIIVASDPAEAGSHLSEIFNPSHSLTSFLINLINLWIVILVGAFVSLVNLPSNLSSFPFLLFVVSGLILSYCLSCTVVFLINLIFKKKQ